MSWRKFDPIREGFGHVTSAIHDKLLCDGYFWNKKYFAGKCKNCIMCNYDQYDKHNPYKYYIKETYNIIDRIEREEEY